MNEAESFSKPRPVCFMVMPYGVKRTGVARGDVPSKIDFDLLWREAFEPAIQALGYNPVRADHDIGASIIHEMLERLTLADLIIADLTIANSNVYYEVGVRHAANKTGCVLTSADWAVPLFDVAQMRRVTYPLPGEVVTREQLDKIRSVLEHDVPELELAQSPVFNLPGYPNVDASATTSFKNFVDELSEFQAAVRAIRKAPPAEHEPGVRKLMRDLSVEDDGAPVIPAVALELLKLIRDCLEWKDTVRYINALPKRLRELPSVQEQLWLARAKTGDRTEAICHLEKLIERHGSTPTRHALIAGRYKRLYYDAEGDSPSRRKHLKNAIKHYEECLLLDLNGHWAPANLPTLLREQGHPGDRERAEAIDHLAHLSYERADKFNLRDEWLNLARLQTAFDEGDPTKAREALDRLEEDDIVHWALEITLKDLEHSRLQVEDEQVRLDLGKILEELRQQL